MRGSSGWLRWTFKSFPEDFLCFVIKVRHISLTNAQATGNIFSGDAVTLELDNVSLKPRQLGDGFVQQAAAFLIQSNAFGSARIRDLVFRSTIEKIGARLADTDLSRPAAP